MRRPRTVSLALCAALVLAACSSTARQPDPVADASPAPKTPTCTTKMPTSTKGPVTVTVAEAFDSRSQAAADQLVAQFNASQSQIHVVLQPRGSDAAVEQQLAGSSTTYRPSTMVVLDDIRTQAVADSGKILPASLCLKASRADDSVYLPAARSYYTVATVQQAASANLTAPLLFFDRTAFRAAGLDPSKPPTTLNELYQDALKLKAANPTSLPLAMTLSSWWVESWLTGDGTAFVNNDSGRSAPASGSTFDNPRTLAIHQWFQKMYSADLIDLVPDTPGQHAQDVDLATRRSAMLIESSTAINQFDALEFHTLDPTLWGEPATTVLPPPGPALDIDAAPLPGLSEAGRGQVSGSAWYLSAADSPAEQAAAWTFMTWWNASPQQVQWSLQGSYLPYNTKAIGDPELEQVWQHSRRGRWLDTAYTEMTDFDTQSPGPLIGPYSAVRAAIEGSVTSVTRGDTDPQITVNETDTTIEADLVEYQLAHPTT